MPIPPTRPKTADERQALSMAQMIKELENKSTESEAELPNKVTDHKAVVEKRHKHLGNDDLSEGLSSSSEEVHDFSPDMRAVSAQSKEYLDEMRFRHQADHKFETRLRAIQIREFRESQKHYKTFNVIIEDSHDRIRALNEQIKSAVERSQAEKLAIMMEWQDPVNDSVQTDSRNLQGDSQTLKGDSQTLQGDSQTLQGDHSTTSRSSPAAESSMFDRFQASPSPPMGESTPELSSTNYTASSAPVQSTIPRSIFNPTAFSKDNIPQSSLFGKVTSPEPFSFTATPPNPFKVIQSPLFSGSAPHLQKASTSLFGKKSSKTIPPADSAKADHGQPSNIVPPQLPADARETENETSHERFLRIWTKAPKFTTNFVSPFTNSQAQHPTTRKRPANEQFATTPAPNLRSNSLKKSRSGQTSKVKNPSTNPGTAGVKVRGSSTRKNTLSGFKKASVEDGKN